MIIASQLRAARSLLGWSQDDLAQRSGVSKPTIARLELVAGPIGGHETTRQKLIATIEAGGVIFLATGDVLGGGPGVRLKSST